MTLLLQRRFIEAPADLAELLGVRFVCCLKVGVVPHGAVAAGRVNQTGLTVHVLVHQSLDAVVVGPGGLKAELSAGLFATCLIAYLRLLLA